MKAYRWSGGTAQLIFNLGTLLRWQASFNLTSLCLTKNPW